MSLLYAPSDMGFDDRLEAIDRCQISLLREVSALLGGRLILKGGMAMRTAFGSMRLTRDIDLDRDQTISQDALKKNLERILARAASAARIRAPKAQITKDTRTTVRARLEGSIGGGADIRFEVEVSGRDTPAAENLRTEIVTPPAKYAMAPFPVISYNNEALAAMKIGAALSAQRNAPRDLYDLRDLIWAGTDPTGLLAKQDAALLEDFSGRVLDKLEMLSFRLAQQELLPYLALQDRLALTEERWIEMTLMVADAIQAWCKAALELQQEQGQRRSPSARQRS